MPIYNFNKIKYLVESSPPTKKRISTSTKKVTPLCTNYNNYNNYYYYPNKNKCPSYCAGNPNHIITATTFWFVCACYKQI